MFAINFTLVMISRAICSCCFLFWKIYNYIYLMVILKFNNHNDEIILNPFYNNPNLVHKINISPINFRDSFVRLITFLHNSSVALIWKKSDFLLKCSQLVSLCCLRYYREVNINPEVKTKIQFILVPIDLIEKS